jgi:hypothetical protein
MIVRGFFIFAGDDWSFPFKADSMTDRAAAWPSAEFPARRESRGRISSRNDRSAA